MGFLARLALIICAAALFAGCGAQNGIRAVPQGAAAQNTAHKVRASYSALLYVINGYATHMYSYPGLKPEGEISSETIGSGCPDDATGFLYFFQLGSNELFQYPYGGTASTGTIIGPEGYQIYGCAADPTTGSLAVTFEKTASRSGYVSVYASGSTSNPTDYYDDNLIWFDLCAYDSSGNLFILGERPNSGWATLSELPKGSSTFVDLTLSEHIGFDGLQWDGSHLANYEGSERGGGRKFPFTIYRLSISGSYAKVIGTSHLKGALRNAWIQGDTVMSNLRSIPNRASIGFYHYPKGGKFYKKLYKKLSYHAAGVAGLMVAHGPSAQLRGAHQP